MWYIFAVCSPVLIILIPSPSSLSYPSSSSSFFPSPSSSSPSLSFPSSSLPSSSPSYPSSSPSSSSPSSSPSFPSSSPSSSSPPSSSSSPSSSSPLSLPSTTLLLPQPSLSPLSEEYSDYVFLQAGSDENKERAKKGPQNVSDCEVSCHINTPLMSCDLHVICCEVT